jgi:hypothetical protein
VQRPRGVKSRVLISVPLQEVKTAMDSKTINQKLDKENNRVGHPTNNVIDFRASMYKHGLFFADPYNQALWRQIRERKAREDTLFPTER